MAGRMGRSPLGTTVLLVALLAPVGELASQEGGEEVAEDAREGEVATAETPAFTAAPRSGEVVIDGRIEEEAWDAADVATDFVQARPVEGVPAEHDTEARILFDDESIYVAARMYDSSPSTIADQLVRRDRPGQFDFIEVGFDPNLDQRTGYSFQVSAAGVQSDSYLYEDRRRDDAWDAVWESAVARDSLGWTAELRIPLSQIRYEPADSAQTWGVNFRRERLASNEETHYSLVSRLQEGVVSQFGRLHDVRIPEAARRLEFLPYAVGRAHTGPAEEGDPFFDGNEADARIGTDFKMGIGGNFTLDATVNPDFGQVEADPAVINLTAFETFFEERRPFFVEDARIFDFNLSGGRNSLFYSRRLGRTPHGRAPRDAEFSEIPDNTTILGAAKLSGRTEGGLSVGALAAATGREHGRAYFPDTGQTREFLVEPPAQYGVFRLQQDFNDGASQIGGIVTGMRRSLPADGSFDHLTSEAFNGGVDFELQWNDREWALFGFMAGSHVRGDTTALIELQESSTHYFQRPDAPYVEMDSTATSMSGAEWRLQFERRRGDWTGAVWAAEVTPGFEINDLGFSQVQERLDGGASIGYRDITPGEHLRSWNVRAFTFQNWSHDVLKAGVGTFQNWQDAHLRGTIQTRGEVEFLNYWQVDANFGYGPQSMSRTATRGGPVMVEPANFNFGMGLRSDRRDPFNFRPNVRYRWDILGSGREFRAGINMEIRPTNGLEIRLDPTVTVQTDPAQYVATTDVLPYAPTFDRRYLFGKLERREFSMETRVDWAFSPTLTLQVFAQPFLSAGDYVQYRQLAEPGTFRFDEFEEGQVVESGGEVRCVGGRTCEDGQDVRYIDFDGDGTTDYTFDDEDFNFRSLIGNAVLRWEFRPGSRIFLVWQRQQRSRVALGDFSFDRDASALFDAPADDVFILKVDYWIGL